MNVYAGKFEASCFYGSWEIFDERFNIGLHGETEERNNGQTNMPRKSIVSYTIELVIILY